MQPKAAILPNPVPRPSTHPSIYAVLDLPFGAVNGYLTVAIAYQLAQAGVSAESIGALIALYLMPQIWKPLWAPLVDITLSAKSWYVIGTVLSALGVLAMAACSAPPVMASLATTFLGMGVEALIAHSTAPEQRGRAGGWLQAGNFAGGGIGGGAALWLGTHVTHTWITGAVLGACFLLCCFGLLLVRESHRGARVASPGIRAVLRDLWGVARSARGYLALLVLFLPIGSGGASALFAVIPDDWHSSANIPTAYLSAIEGWARTRHGVNAFLYVDFAAPIVGALIFGTVLVLTAGRSAQALKVRVS
jgi:hypothetical protein